MVSEDMKPGTEISDEEVKKALWDEFKKVIAIWVNFL